MLQSYVSVFNRVAVASCLWMVSSFATPSQTPGHQGEVTTQSTEHHPAFCQLTPAGLACLQDKLHLPNVNLAASQGSISGRPTLNQHRCWTTLYGLARARPTYNTKSQYQTKCWVYLPAQPMWTSSPSFHARREPQPVPAALKVHALPSQVSDSDDVMADDFETGDLTGWSGSYPNQVATITLDGEPEDGGCAGGDCNATN